MFTSSARNARLGAPNTGVSGTDYGPDADESTKKLCWEMNKSNLQRYKESLERPPPPVVSINVVEEGVNFTHGFV